MERWGAILLSVFAVYRIAMLVSNEEGPFSLAERFRTGVRRRTEGKASEWIARGVECPRCVSFWLSAVAALILVQRGYVPHEDILLAWFGVAGVVFLMLVLIPFEIKLVAPDEQSLDGHSASAEEFFARQFERRYQAAPAPRNGHGAAHAALRRPQDGDGYRSRNSLE